MINISLKSRIVSVLLLSIFLMASSKKVLSQTTQPNLRIRAQSVILMDAISGQILYEQTPQLKIAPASFVKILTLYVAFDAIRAGNLKMDDVVTVSTKAWKTGGSKMFLKSGERVRVEDLIKGIAVVSGNDACVALAENISGTEEVFVSKMNEKAKMLGLEGTQFQNSHGMPMKDQYTTALDMAILARRYIEAHPEALTLHSTLSFEHNGILQRNRNVLLQRDIGVDGLMTGHVEESGYHLLLTARREGSRLIAVIMGSKSLSNRAREAQDLLKYGFGHFSVVEAFKKGSPLGEIKVVRGKMSRVELIAAEDGRVVVTKGEEKSVSVNSELPSFIDAPIRKGQRVGKVLIQSGGKVLREVDLLSSSDVPKGFPFLWLLIGGGILGLLLVGLIAFLRMFRSHRKRIR
jgi:D-alanyl-D-alanine carboxypeptidase (penicillin-binding protein 5/6)